MNNQNTEYKFAKTVLLLGAGFTKNFGGLLADEMWAQIFNHKEIQAQPRIKKLMLNKFDYEEIYYSVLENSKDEEDLPPFRFKIEEQKAIKSTTKSAYNYIDEVLREYLNDYYSPKSHILKSINDLTPAFKFQKLGYKYTTPGGGTYHIVSSSGEKSFIFTLNQDLFFERLYHNNYDLCQLSIPGIENDPEWFTTRFNKPLKSKDYRKLPTEDKLKPIKDNLLEKGEFFLIKLHGSYNWISSNGLDMMVIGRGKINQIKNEPLLEHYFEIFKTVLSQGQRRLLIIGYGFGDKHINSVIANAIEKYELKVYILTPESPKNFKEKLCNGCNAKEGIIIWNGISGYFQCVNEILLDSTNNNKIAKEQFFKTVFDEK